MKISALIILPAFYIGGCKSIATIQPNTLHVTAARDCEEAGVEGTYEGKKYVLAADRENGKYEAACYDPIGPQDVGKDFHAALNPERGTLTVQIVDPPRPSQAVFDIQSAEEIPK